METTARERRCLEEKERRATTFALQRDQSAPVRSLTAVGMAAVFYGVLVILTLAWEASLGVLN